jgi:transposase
MILSSLDEKRKGTLQMKYIGLDAHSKRCFFAVINGRGKAVTSQYVKTTDSELLRFVRSIKGRKALVFEEGVVSQWLYLLLKDEVDALVVCQPLKRNGGPKTDKIDAFELADLLRVNRLKSVFHADSELFKIRTLISGYDDVVGSLTRAKNRYKALYRQVAIQSSGTRIFTDETMIGLLPTESQRLVALMLFEQIAVLERQKAAFRNEFEANARRYKPIRLMMSIPGIGAVRANQIVGIMVTPHRFANKYKLYSYAMLTKHSQTSDGKDYGKKKPRGQAILKNVFSNCAVSAVRSQNAFRRKYDEKRSWGSKDHTARVAVAQKYAATVLGVWKSGKKYDDNYTEERRRNSRTTGNSKG